MWRLLLLRWWNEDRWVFADVVDERRERRVAKERFDQSAVTIILLQQSGVLVAEICVFLSFNGEVAFELADVFCEKSVCC